MYVRERLKEQSSLELCICLLRCAALLCSLPGSAAYLHGHNVQRVREGERERATQAKSVRTAERERERAKEFPKLMQFSWRRRQ